MLKDITFSVPNPCVFLFSVLLIKRANIAEMGMIRPIFIIYFLVT